MPRFWDRWHPQEALPLRIAGLQLWLDASRITGLADGDAVTTWSDLSGNGNHATQSGSTRPTYKTAIVNGRPVVRFASASSQYMDGAVLTGFSTINDAATLFIVAKFATTAGALFEASDSLLSVNRSFSLFYSGALLLRRATNDASGAFSDTTSFHVFSGTTQNASRFLYQDGTQIATSAAGVTMNAAPTTYRVGALMNNPGGQVFFNGDAGAVLLYNRVLSSGEHSRIVRVLGGQFAIAVA